MTTDPPSESTGIPAAAVERKRGFSLVWIVPILAAGIGAWLWWDAAQQRGPEIILRFATADGLEAGKTKIRFKSVEVGQIESVELEPDLSAVVAKAQMGHGTEPLLREGSRFWVERPRIGLGGVSGLGTLLSGAYVAVDPALQGGSARDFTALKDPPQTPADAPGLKLRLTTDALGSISIGSPVSHHGIVVGKVEAYRLLDDSERVGIDVYIEPEYAQRVHANSRFWNASGIDISFGAEGLKFSASSLVSLLTGGIEFDTPSDEGVTPLAQGGATYILYPDRTSSREVFRQTREVVSYFAGSVRGLSQGAPVEYRGSRLGTVESFGLANTSIEKALTRVVIEIEPERIGREFQPGESPQDYVNRLIGAGVRARLSTSSLLTGALFVEIVLEPEAPATLHGVEGELEIPTVASMADELAAMAEELPELMADARRTVAALADLASSPDVQGAVGDVRDVSAAARQVLLRADEIFSSIQKMLDEQSSLQIRVAEAVEEVANGMRSIRHLADTLERQPEALIKGKSSSPGDR